MKQNKYDDPVFFERYSNMRRSTGGLEEAAEWHAFRALLPELSDKRVLDLGCGFGWHCRYAAEQGARSVVGTDLSEKMLARAKESTDDDRIVYRQAAIEEVSFAEGEFDVVISSLALHYVERFDLVCRQVHRALAKGGWFIFSVEHPIFTANEAQEWCYDSQDRRRHWPVDNYRQEGARNTHWLEDTVIKYHRTVERYVNTLTEADFVIRRLCEPEPEAATLEKYPDSRDETRRPMFLLISTVSGMG